jgi:hypothetical protein
MSIRVENDIYGDGGKAKEVVFCLHLPVHLKHSNHMTKGETDSFEWGIGGKCDDKLHKVSCKVNIPLASDEHPEIEARSGDTVTVKFSDGKYKLSK